VRLGRYEVFVGDTEELVPLFGQADG
jgi:hypothetical protein